jgi:hypothetical protein
MARSGQIRPASDTPASGEGGQTLPDSDASSIPMTGCYWILVSPGFRRPTIAVFRQLDIKRA